MVNTKVVILFSNFAKYEYLQIVENFPNYKEKIESFIRDIKSNPHDMESISMYRNHRLEKKKDFEQLEDFISYDVDNKYRFLWKIIYESYKDKGEYIPFNVDIESINLKENQKEKIWKDIILEESNCEDDRFVYIYVVNVCFNDHNTGNLSKCSIDYERKLLCLEPNKDSPFKGTKYDIELFDYYENLLKK